MPNISDNTLHQLDALNNWLGDVYGKGTNFDTLLLDAGFSEAQIEQIKQDHLSELLQAVLDLLAGYTDLSSEGRNMLMVQHYGLIDGKPLDFYTIGNSVGVSGARIRQLVTMRLKLYRDPKRQAVFQNDFAAIGRRLLDNQSRIRSISPLKLHWNKNYLTISGDPLTGKEIRIHYLEAYCRDQSTDADWDAHTKIPHQTELLEASDDRTFIKLKCVVEDGLEVTHEIRSTSDEVDFRILAHNPTDKRSEAHWAQPCIRLDKFTGADQETYLAKSFIFLDGELARMPTKNWATEARYTPGQVWCPKGVDRGDVNPRPLSALTPSNGLIGCFSDDETMIFAAAFEPYQELFQGIIVCLHADFRLGGVQAGESKHIRGKIYIVPNNVPALLKRYAADFPEHASN